MKTELDRYSYPKTDNWFPACGGSETPFFIAGTKWLYVYNPIQMEHGYMNMDSDIVYSESDYPDFYPELS